MRASEAELQKNETELQAMSKQEAGEHFRLMARGNVLADVKAILAIRPDVVNSTCEYDMTALMEAALKGHVEVVCALLSRSTVDVNLKNYQQMTALMLAARHGHTEVVCALLSRSTADVNLKNYQQMTALMLAAEHGHTEVVCALLSHLTVDVNLKNYQQMTALMLAARHGHTEVVRAMLLHETMGTDFIDEEGNRAQDYAEMRGHADIVTLISNRPSDRIYPQPQITSNLGSAVHVSPAFAPAPALVPTSETALLGAPVPANPQIKAVFVNLVDACEQALQAYTRTQAGGFMHRHGETGRNRAAGFKQLLTGVKGAVNRNPKILERTLISHINFLVSNLIEAHILEVKKIGPSKLGIKLAPGRAPSSFNTKLMQALNRRFRLNIHLPFSTRTKRISTRRAKSLMGALKDTINRQLREAGARFTLENASGGVAEVGVTVSRSSPSAGG